MNTINKDDFLRMVRNQQLEVLTSAQLQINTGAVHDFIQKALTTELTDIEKSQANQLITDIGQFDCWCVLRDDFTKAVVYTRPAQVEWDGAERGEFDEVIKARSGVYKPTAENKKLGRVGQKYDRRGESGSYDRNLTDNERRRRIGLPEQPEKKKLSSELDDKASELEDKKHGIEIKIRNKKELYGNNWDKLNEGFKLKEELNKVNKELAELQIKDDEKKTVKIPHDERGYPSVSEIK